MNDADFTGRTLGGFKILRKLGAGGMAVVYQAHEGSLNRVVALKVIHEHLSKQPEFIARFQREARAAAQLSHPNIVQIYAVGEDKGVPFFSMEHVKGHSLHEVIQNEGFLTAPRVVRILEQACQALMAAHEAGIVHRDIKPHNILVDASGRIKVADFGIAHMATESRLTQSGMLVGTPDYTPPELCLGAPLDARSDIYALGVTAYEMLTGRTPFNADTPGALIRQIVDGSPPPLATVNPTVPPALREIVERMMNKNPDERFQTAEAVLQALTRSDADVRQVTIPQPSQPTVGRVVERTIVTPAQPAPSPAEVKIAAPSAPSRMRRLLPMLIILPIGAAAAGTAAFFAMRILDARNAVAPNDPSSAVVDVTSATESSVPGVPEAPAEPPPPEASAVSNDVTETLAGAVAEPVVNAAGAAIAPDAAAPTSAAPPGADAESLVSHADSDARAPGLSSSGATTPVPAAEPEVVREAVPPVVAPSAGGSSSERSGDRRSAAAPPPRVIVSSTVGDYENVDLVAAGIESAMIRSGFEILDLVPRAPDLREVARFEIVSTVKLVGARELSFAGRRDTAYTVSITVQATDLLSGTRAAGPFAATAEYTSLNIQARLQQAIDELTADLTRDLEARIAASR